jgi:hypothetical protein
MAAALVATVEAPGVRAVELPEGAGQTAGALGNGHQMDMIAHQAVTQQPHAVMARLLAQMIEVKPAILVYQEDLLPVVAALGDVMRDAVRHQPRLAGHEVSDRLTYISRLSRFSSMQKGRARGRALVNNCVTATAAD